MIVKMKDICTKIGSGATPRGGKDAYNDEGISLIRSQNILDFSFSHDGLTYINEEQARKLNGVTVEVDDVLLNITGDSVARVCIVDNDILPARVNQHVCILRGDKDKVLSSFILYFLQMKKQELLQMASGGATRNALTKGMIEELDIDIPTIDEQKKIVSLLGSIQEKLKTNNKINRNLQDQLKTIFNSWFYEMAPFGGKEPEGTKYINLEELCTVITKGTTPTTLGMPFTDDGINFIKGETILDNHGFDRTKLSFVSEDTHEKLKRSQIESGDIVFTIAGTLGRFALVDDSMIPANTNQAVAIVRANRVSPEYLYSFFIGNWHNDYYTKRIQQAVQANLSLGTIKSLPIMILPKDLYEQYLDIITPLIIETKRIEKENLKLAELRDSLLPKLMSGELDVFDLEV